MTMRRATFGNITYLFATSADSPPGLSDSDAGARLILTDRKIMYSWTGDQWVPNTSGLIGIACRNPFVTRNSANAAGDSTYQTLDTINVPAGIFHVQAALRVQVVYGFNNSAATKQYNIQVGSGSIGAPSVTTGNIIQSYLSCPYANGNLLTMAAMNTNGEAVTTTNAFLNHTGANWDLPVAIVFQARWSSGAVPSEAITLYHWRVDMVL